VSQYEIKAFKKETKICQYVVEKKYAKKDQGERKIEKCFIHGYKQFPMPLL